jgi:hypothetical protein
VYERADGRRGDWQPGCRCREALQKIDVVEKGVAETFSGGGKVGPGIFEDVLEIG